MGFPVIQHLASLLWLVNLGCIDLNPWYARCDDVLKAPGGLSRWSTKHSMEWKPVQPKLVAEVQFDHFTGGRFRHGTKFLRWRPEKDPRGCTMKQVQRENRSALGLL
jgi:hypothetical protein